MKQQLVCLTLVVMMCGVVFSGCTEQQQTPLPPPTDETRARQILGYMNNGTLDTVYSSWFTTTIQQVVSAEQVQTAWGQLQQQLGTFENITHVRVTTTQNYTNVFLTCLFFNQQTYDVEVTFNEQQVVAGLHFVQTDLSGNYRPPSYANVSAFTETNVTVGAGTAWPLPGTLSMPNGAGPFPAVVLVQGSGPNDRDETILANKPFKDLAWGLASQGIAVLRYEKRTKQYGAVMTKQLDNITVYNETVQDAQRAVALLRSTPGVNPDKVFVLGHSLGAMLAPRIAANITGVAGLILLAAPARHIEDLVVNQTIYLADLDGNVTAVEHAQIEAAINASYEIRTLNISAGQVVLGAGRAYWADLATYNQIAVALNLSLPMMLLQGKRDYQVNYTYDFLRWQAALGARPNVVFHAYDNLSHLFMPASEPPSNKDYTVPANVAKEVVDDIAAWVKGT